MLGDDSVVIPLSSKPGIICSCFLGVATFGSLGGALAGGGGTGRSDLCVPFVGAAEGGNVSGTAGEGMLVGQLGEGMLVAGEGLLVGQLGEGALVDHVRSQMRQLVEEQAGTGGKC